jgi:SAM-dependent methyltransferase
MSSASAKPQLDLANPSIHSGARILSRDPLGVATPQQLWAYAVSFALPPPDAGERSAWIVDLQVITGRIGIGITTVEGDRFLTEKFLEPGRRRVRLGLTGNVLPGRLVLRNADLRGRESEFVVSSITQSADGSPTYLVDLAPRDFHAEQPPEGGGGVVFDDDAARAINDARLAWLEAAELPVAGKRVLDAGCGVGHFTPFYLRQGCSVVGVDGRQENIDVMRGRHPNVAGHVADVQDPGLARLGTFDVVHCFGLLYHLDSPVAALRNIFAVCREFLILETMVCDSSRPVTVLADETKTVNQALAGLGCRPSPTFIALALNRIGFRHVYGTSHPPQHPDFLFAWQDNLETGRDGHNFRCVFVASREPIESPRLVPLIDQ